MKLCSICNIEPVRRHCTSYCKECRKPIEAKYRKHRKYKIRDTVLRRTYGISTEEYNELFSKQKGCCTICNKHQSEFKKRLCVDHCHTTNKVRSLLCSDCNLGLGNFREDKDLLLKARDYLSKHETANQGP